MQHTENYNLNLFESGDPVLAENFNANTQVIDRELGTRLHSVSFEYEGSGERTRVFKFSHKPVLVFLNDGIGGTRHALAQWGNTYVHALFYAFNAVQQQIMSAAWSQNTEDGTWEMTLETQGGYGTEDGLNATGTTYRCTAFLE